MTPSIDRREEVHPLTTASVAAPSLQKGVVAADASVDAETAQYVADMLARVATARGLPVKRPVATRELDRAEMIAHIRSRVEREIPPDIVAHQGEALTALELIPADYDFVAGVYRLVEGRIAGFYEPAEQTMYLADDLDEENATETLAHELVHALQDQAYELEPMMEFKEGDGDRTAALQALAEGDAVSAMLDVTVGSAFKISPNAFRRVVDVSTDLSGVGLTTPRFLKSSLGAPYSDGFAFVQDLRQRGGWAGVDEAWKTRPESTEQILHPEKLAAREPAISIPPPTIAPLGEGFRRVTFDVMGELGTRIAFEDWTNREGAAAAAAGWGGDRYVIAARENADASGDEFAFAWRIRFDTPKDATEAASVLRKRFGPACQKRPVLGPVAWKAAQADLILVAGPYERSRKGGKPVGKGSCDLANRWIGAIARETATAM